VADNYKWNLYKAMEKNNKLFSTVIGEAVEAMAGVLVQGPW